MDTTVKQRKPRTVRCSAHCAACGLHFSSTAAFDKHRIGSFEPDERKCLHPLDAKPGRFAVLTEAGECRVYEHCEGYGIARGVVVWTKGDLQARREALSALTT